MGTAITGVLSRPPDIPYFPISELVKTCEALPDFCTLQIVHSTHPNHRRCWCKREAGSCTEVWDEMLREQVGGVSDWAIACLKVGRMGRQQGEGKWQAALREQVSGVRDWAANRNRKPDITREREGRGSR